MSEYWLNQPSVLIKDYIRFFPTGKMSRIEQLNSLARFSFYYIIVLALFKKPQSYYMIPIVLLILNIVFYKIYINDPNREIKELIRIKKDNSKEIKEKIYQLESGYIDPNGEYKLGPVAEIKDHLGKDIIDYELNELLEFNKKTCRKPTRANPFMNPPVTDLNTEFDPAACNADDEDIKTNIVDNFNLDLYRDLSDLWDRKNSQRIWYTVAHANPPDQPAIANWLYKNEGPCKVRQQKCLRYEDLRFKR
jgi:hypothetical protein